MGRFGVFSFHGTKTLTTGEGGIFVTDDPDLYEEVLSLSNHGRVRGQVKQFWPDRTGFKYKMSNIQAALGCAQLERIDELVARKCEIFLYYLEGLKNVPSVRMNPEKPETRNGYWMPTAVFATETRVTRERLLELFKAENIDGRVFFYPLSSLPMFSAQPANRHSYDLPRRSVNLPSYYEMTPSEQDRVLGVLRSALAKPRGKP